MSYLGLLVTVVMAGTLLWAGLEKARDLASFASLLRQLGASATGAAPIARLIVALELGVAASLVLAPSTATLIGVVVIATGFAVAGLIAIRRNERIRCGCFGPFGAGPLGRNQLVAFPFWVAAAALLRLTGATLPDGVDRSELAAIVALTIATIRALLAVREAYAARDDRRSASTMFLWLNR